MKVATPYIYKVYRDYIKSLFNKLYKDKKSIIEDRSYIYRLLEKYSDDLKNSKLNIDKIRELYRDDINRSDVYNLKLYKLNVDISEEDSDIAKLGEHIKGHVSTYIKLTRELANINTSINKLKKCKVKLRVFSKLLNNINTTASKKILAEGYEFKLGKRLGSIYISMIDNNKSKKLRKTIDWGESLKTLNAIARDLPEAKYLVEAYERKEIKKNEFIASMKKYTYTKDTPDKPKWLVYGTRERHPFWHWSKHSASSENYYLYSFVPTNFVHNETRSQIDFTDNATNIEEIVETSLLGNKDKVNAILRFEPNHEIHYRN